MKHSPRTRKRQPRRGLAPLELVLSLPLLCMALALMVVVGAAGAWKVRTLANSRQAVFRAMWPRTTDGDPLPPNWWPESATMSYAESDESPLPQDPFAEHVVVRGPTIGDVFSGRTLDVILDTLDMGDGMHVGTASIDHEPAMWPTLDRRNRFTRRTEIFVGQTWQFGNMELSANVTRRILATYDYNMGRYDPSAYARVIAAASALADNPDRPALGVLDRDEELRAHFGGGWLPPAANYYGGRGYIDFHPRVPYVCENDPQALRDLILEDLEQRIGRVPQRMATRFRQMYQEQLDALRAMNPRPDDFAMQEAELLLKIAQLDAFLSTL